MHTSMCLGNILYGCKISSLHKLNRSPGPDMAKKGLNPMTFSIQNDWSKGKRDSVRSSEKKHGPKHIWSLYYSRVKKNGDSTLFIQQKTTWQGPHESTCIKWQICRYRSGKNQYTVAMYICSWKYTRKRRRMIYKAFWEKGWPFLQGKISQVRDQTLLLQHSRKWRSF